MISFTGLTGAVGTEIVKLLPEYDIQARGLVRNPDKAGAIRKAGVEVVHGDLEDKDAVKAALRGCVETVSELFGLIAQGSCATLNDEYTRVTGRAPTTLRQFFQDYSSFFEKG